MKQVEYRKNIPPAQNVNVKCESDLQFRPHLISTKARIPFFVFFFVSLVFWTAILDFCGGFRWQLVPKLPFPVPRSPLPLPLPPFSNIQNRSCCEKCNVKCILVALDFTCSFTWLLMTFVVNKRTFKVRTLYSAPPGGGGTAIYGLYRYVPLWRVWFSSSLL